MHTHFFDFHDGGYVLGYQHIFWFYSHPAVYIMMLPGFGIASEVISVMSRKPIFGYRLMALSLCAILVLGFSVWAHHMFVSGMAPWLRVPMMITTLLIAVPTGIKVFSWLATTWEGRIELSDAHAVRARLRVDVRDRRALRDHARRGPDRHPHLGLVLHRRAHPLRAARRLAVHDLRRHLLLVPEDDRADVQRAARASSHFWLTFIGFNATFFPMHIIGIEGHEPPRLRLRAEVRDLEHVHLARVVLPRRVVHGVRLQHDRQLDARAAAPARTRGAR